MDELYTRRRMKRVFTFLKSLFDSKVDKVEGKGLSTNDFSDDAATALRNVIASDQGKAPTKHASSQSTYGLGTGGNYGHVRIVSGDLNGRTLQDGEAAAGSHTHSQYLTHHQDISGKADKTTVYSKTEVDDLIDGFDNKFILGTTIDKTSAKTQPIGVIKYTLPDLVALDEIRLDIFGTFGGIWYSLTGMYKTKTLYELFSEDSNNHFNFLLGGKTDATQISAGISMAYEDGKYVLRVFQLMLGSDDILQEEVENDRVIVNIYYKLKY